MPEVVLLIVDGLQVPATPLSDVVGNDATASPLQIVSDGKNENAGTVLGVTVTENVSGTAHIPAVGVNV